MVAAMPRAATVTDPGRTGVADHRRRAAVRRPRASTACRCGRSTARRGQRNTTSLQYHFGDRAGPAAGDHGQARAGDRRPAATRCSTSTRPTATPDIRRLASAFVLPLVAKLHDPTAAAATCASPPSWSTATTASIEPGEPSILADPTGRDPARQHHPVGPARRRRCCRRSSSARRCTAATRRCASPTSSSAAGPASRSHRSDALFTSHLVDLVASILVTPVSDETAALARAAPLQPPRRSDEPCARSAGTTVVRPQGAAMSAAVRVVSCSSVGCSTVARRSAWRRPPPRTRCARSGRCRSRGSAARRR